MAVTRLLVALALLGAAGAAPGQLDPAFGTGGKVLTDFGAYDEATGVALQQDGKIVVAGATGWGDDFSVARYSADGVLDRRFGRRGRVWTNLGGDDDAFDVAIQSDGRIVAAGSSGGDFALARYDADGKLDPSFGGDGRVTTDLGGVEGGRGVAVQPNGRIVVAGSTEAGEEEDVVLARYLPDGRLDPAFGREGTVVMDIGGDEYAEALALQPDGKIVVAGYAAEDGYWFSFALARFTRGGRLDRAFGDDGVVLTEFRYGPAYALAVALQPDGKIVAAGSAWSLGEPQAEGGARLSVLQFGLARYRSDGRLDPGFGDGGTVMTGLGGDAAADAVAVQTDGKLVAVGGAWRGDFAYARYHHDGALDVTSLTDLGGRIWDDGNDVALQKNGKAVAVGVSGGDFAVVRYLAN
jgi:uncharacterized delta-60 repeat protein